MKKYIKLLTIVVVAFVMMVGITVNAEVEQWYSEMEVVLPLHKTDENGKGLEGAIFTLKDLNNTISYSSSDVKNGDYLIETYKESPEVLDKIIDSLPSNYKEVITGIKSWDDVQALHDRDDMYVDYDDWYTYVHFIIPLKVEETVAPNGYEKQDYVVVGGVSFNFERMNNDYIVDREDIEARSEYFDEFYDNGVYIYANLYVYEMPLFSTVPGYFEYDLSKNYEAIFQELNKEIAAREDDSYEGPEDYMNVMKKIFEGVGYNTKDIKCPEVNYEPVEMLKRENLGDIQLAVRAGSSCYYGGGATLRDDIEARFDDYIEDCYCVIQIKDKKQTITVNPATASTIGIISRSEEGV